MSLENPPAIPFELVKELADLLEFALDWSTFPEDREQEACLALDDYKTRVALG